MDKLKAIKIKQADGQYGEAIPIGADADNIDMSSGKTLQETMGNVDVDADGSVEEQLDQLNKNKGNEDISKYYNSSVTNILNTELGNPSIFILSKDPIIFPSQPETREEGVKYLIDLSTSDIYDLFDAYLNQNIGNNVYLRMAGKEGVTNSLGQEQAVNLGIIGYASAVESGTNLDNETFAVPTNEALKDDSLPIKRYRIQRKLRNKAGFGYQKYGRILITCCTHGLEKTGIVVLLNLLESIKKQNNKLVLDLLTYFDIDIVPCVNPSGINRSVGKSIVELESASKPGRRNARGVNLNRNFQRGWNNLPTSVGLEGYKGPFPISEQESIALNNIFNDDYCLVLDLHTTSYSGKNFISQGVTDSWLFQRIFSHTLEQMQTRLVNVYNRDIISEMISGGVGTNIVSVAGTGGIINDFTDAIGNIDTSMLIEMPKIQNEENGSRFFYSEESQRYSTEIILTFLYNYYLYIDSQGGRTPRETYEKEKLSIYNMYENLLSMDPKDWMTGSIDLTQVYPGLVKRGIVKQPIKIKKGTKTLVFKNFSPLYTARGEDRKDTWKLQVNYGAGPNSDLPESIYSWTTVEYGGTYKMKLLENYEYVWLYFRVLDTSDEEINIRTSEIGLTYIFSLNYLTSTEEIDVDDFANTLHQQYTKINTGTDLNDMTSPGIYYSENSAITRTLINIPTEITYGFQLNVFKTYGSGTYVTQIITYQEYTYRRRTNSNDGISFFWTSWKKDTPGTEVESKTE